MRLLELTPPYSIWLSNELYGCLSKNLSIFYNFFFAAFVVEQADNKIVKGVVK